MDPKINLKSSKNSQRIRLDSRRDFPLFSLILQSPNTRFWRPLWGFLKVFLKRYRTILDIKSFRNRSNICFKFAGPLVHKRVREPALFLFSSDPSVPLKWKRIFHFRIPWKGILGRGRTRTFCFSQLSRGLRKTGQKSYRISVPILDDFGV